MAQRRFLSKSILETDKFLELTNTQKLLYIFLVLTSDDDGINSNVRTQLYYSNTKKADIEELEKHNMILRDSDSKAVCIVDWHSHNAVPKDRYKETDIMGFKNKLFVDEYARLTYKETQIKYSKYKGGSMNSFIENCIQEIKSNDKNDESKKIIGDSEMSEEVRKNKERLYKQYDEMTGNQ